MKTRTRNGLAAVLLTAGISAPAHAAPPCLAPEPTCALVLLGAVVTTIAHQRDEQETDEEQALQQRVPRKLNVDAGPHMHRQPHPVPARDPAIDQWTMRDDRYSGSE